MAAYPSGSNTFVPQFDASGHLVVAFSRNPKDFALNQYITITPVKKGQGYYLNITAEQAARIINTDLSENLWQDGNDAPDMEWGNESFNFVKYETQRYAYGFRMGWKAVEQADWKIMSSHAALVAQRAMTARTIVALTGLTTTANYASTHTSAVTSLGTGTSWTNASNTELVNLMKHSILTASNQIRLDTLGVVGPRDLVLVVTPNLSAGMSESQEIINYLKQSPFAYPHLKGTEEITSGRWGLPEYLYGVKVVVEDAVRVSSVKGAAISIGNALTTDSNGKEQSLLIARPGALTSNEGAVSFSTGHIFSYEEMKVETKDDPDNRRTLGRIVDDFTFQVVASASGYLFTGCNA